MVSEKHLDTNLHLIWAGVSLSTSSMPFTQRRTEIFAYQGDQSTNPKPNEPPAQFMTLQRNELIPEMNGQYGNLMMTSSAGCSWMLCFAQTGTTS